jgi:hypothetical protein
MWSSSSVAFAILVVLIAATALFYIIGPLQGHDSWVDDICRNTRTLYSYDACGRPEYLSVACAVMAVIYLLLKFYGTN